MYNNNNHNNHETTVTWIWSNSRQWTFLERIPMLFSVHIGVSLWYSSSECCSWYVYICMLEYYKETFSCSLRNGNWIETVLSCRSNIHSEYFYNDICTADNGKWLKWNWSGKKDNIYFCLGKRKKETYVEKGLKSSDWKKRPMPYIGIYYVYR